MKKILFAFVFSLSLSIANAQENNLQGIWILNKSEVKSEVLIKENGIWRDCYKNNSAIKIEGNEFNFYKDEKLVKAKIKQSSNELYIYFKSEEDQKESYTVFNLKTESNTFTISREDPKTFETYTFVKQ